MSVFDPAIFDGDVFDAGTGDAVLDTPDRIITGAIYGLPEMPGTYGRIEIAAEASP